MALVGEPNMVVKKRVCIVSLDLIGPIRNGGIGTAMTALAEALAADGHAVTLLYPSGYTEDRPLTCWIMEYQKKGIVFETLFAEEPEPQLSFLAYHWLKRREFDVIHFHDWRGIGYWSFVAKQQGLAFENTTLVCQVHGQTYWHLRNSGEFLSDIDQLRHDFLEQRSIELADVVYSPSQYMLEWVRGRGWTVPVRSLVWPNVLPERAARLSIDRPRGLRVPIKEIVFFGRLETRKGIELFCAALSRALVKGLKVERITFLGKEGMAGDEPATAYILRATANWKVPYGIVNDLDTRGARTYLSQEGVVAVIASAIENSPYTVLECLADRVPFLAADVGGIAELVHESDRQAVLFRRNAEALSSALVMIGQVGALIAEPAPDVDEAKTKWLSWHSSLSSRGPTRSAPIELPLVSICLSHFSRPHLLHIALDSIERQTYPRIEVILVDDASPDEESKAYLDELESRFASRGWKILRNTEEMWTGAARNYAVQHATGDYVLLMDDDNVAKPNEVEIFVAAALRSGADILTCQQQPFEGLSPPPVQDAELPIGWMPLGPAPALALYENCLGDLNMMVRRSVWQEIGGFTDERCGCEDYEFLAKAVLRGVKLECLPEILFYYRQSGENLASRYDAVALYESFARVLRPYMEEMRQDLRMALLFAANSKLNVTRQSKQGYWRARAGRDPTTERIVSLPKNTGAVLVEMARVALARGQVESARRLYAQALQNSMANKEPHLEPLLTSVSRVAQRDEPGGDSARSSSAAALESWDRP
jgi:glycosyltransferase involved in cell wall biosynthesis